MSVDTLAVEVVPSGGPLGADIRGIDISRGVPEDVFEQILQAWYDHLVLRFCGQDFTDKALVEFALKFGNLHHAAGAEYGGKPEELHEAVELISNIVKDGKPIGALGVGEATWHTDMSMYEIPASATLLYGDEIPPAGGNTRFTNLYLAYEALPERLREIVKDRRSIHDAAYLATGGVRPGYEAVADKSQGPGARHPVVRMHPYTKREALYLGRYGYGYIEGLSLEESDRVLEELWDHMTKPEFIWEQNWQKGDLIVWDNRCVAHMRGSFDPSTRRILRRLTVMDA